MILKTVIVAAMAVLLAVRMMRQRSFRVGRLWVQPAVVLILVGFGLYGTSVTTLSVAAITGGIVIGAALGIWRADTALDHVDVEGRRIMTKPNLVFALVFAATFALKAVVRHGPGASFQEATDFVMCLTAASICAQRLWFYRMFRRAEAGYSGGPTNSVT
jgi:hypothetical protein